MARLVTYTSKLFLKHADPTSRHPENPQRLITAWDVLQGIADKEVEVKYRVSMNKDVLFNVHNRDYVEFIRRESLKGFHYIDPDTYVCEHTFEVAVAAVNSACEAAVRSLREGLPTLALVRPPGHHVGRDGRAFNAPTNGFCIFNNAAAAAMELTRLGLRTLVLDFDAHHGNGTQDILWFERIPHLDLHEWGAYPGSGWFTDVGGDDIGCKVNIPIPRGACDRVYLWVLREVVLPIIAGVRPDALVVSAGFDAHVNDPMTTLQLSTQAYRIIGSLISGLKSYDILSGAVVVLEGGYLPGLAEAFAGFIEGLLKPVNPAELLERLPKSPGTVDEWFRSGCKALMARLREAGLAEAVRP